MRQQSKSGSRASRVRQRAPRKAPIIDPSAGVDKAAANAKAMAVLARLEPKILALHVEAMEKRSTHAIFVLDPHCTWFRAAGGEISRMFQREMKHDADVAVFPLDVLDGLFVILDDMFPGSLAHLRSEPDPESVRLVVMIGEYISVQHYSLASRAASVLHEEPADPPFTLRREGPSAEVQEDGHEGFLLSPTGALRWLFDLNPEDVKGPGAAERIRRFKALGRAAWAAEQARAQPRDFGEVLLAAFGGDAFKAAMARGPDAIFDQIDRVLARAAKDVS